MIMTSRSILTLIVASVTLLVVPAQARIFGTDSAPGPAAPEESRPKAGKPVLDRGMTAQTILQLVGKPEEIVPVGPGEAKGEKWIYRRVVETRHVLDSVTQETIPVFLRANPMEGNVMGTATRPLFSLKHITTYQVTALLMVEGKLVVARQWQEQSQSYDN